MASKLAEPRHLALVILVAAPLALVPACSRATQPNADAPKRASAATPTGSHRVGQALSTTSATAAEPAPALDTPEQRAVDGALAQSSAPAAVVVLALDGPRILALGRHLGADPTTQRRRPGSTVKPLVAWIAAEAGVLRSGETRTCNAIFEGPEPMRCFKSHGQLDLTHALTTSCNIYFFDLGRRLGLARLAAGLSGLGLARPTGLLAGEAVGFIATPEWAATRPDRQKRWELSVSTGHGPFEVTLLELAVAYAEFVKRLTKPSAALPGAIRHEIIEGLRRVVAEEQGTGHGAYSAGLEIAGKTGTAEAESFEQAETATTAGPENGWFVGFTPVAAPRTVVAAVVLGHGSGGKLAAPLVGRIFQRIASGTP